MHSSLGTRTETTALLERAAKSKTLRVRSHGHTGVSTQVRYLQLRQTAYLLSMFPCYMWVIQHDEESNSCRDTHTLFSKIHLFFCSHANAGIVLDPQFAEKKRQINVKWLCMLLCYVILFAGVTGAHFQIAQEMWPNFVKDCLNMKKVRASLRSKIRFVNSCSPSRRKPLFWRCVLFIKCFLWKHMRYLFEKPPHFLMCFH